MSAERADAPRSRRRPPAIHKIIAGAIQPIRVGIGGGEVGRRQRRGRSEHAKMTPENDHNHGEGKYSESTLASAESAHGKRWKVPGKRRKVCGKCPQPLSRKVRKVCVYRTHFPLSHFPLSQK